MRREVYMNFAKKFKSPLAQVFKEPVGPNGSGGGVGVDVMSLKGSIGVSNPKVLKGSGEEEEKTLSKVVKKLQKLSNDELEALLSSDDNFVIDCLLDSAPQISKLKREQDSLQRQVSELARFNYAREPDFVKDRIQLRKILDEAIALKRRIASKHVAPILNKLDKAATQLSHAAREVEERSELVAHEFLDGHKSYDHFLISYTDVRKEAIRKRIMADKLAREKNRLAAISPKPVGDSNSPIPTLRQRKKANLNK